MTSHGRWPGGHLPRHNKRRGEMPHPATRCDSGSAACRAAPLPRYRFGRSTSPPRPRRLAAGRPANRGIRAAASRPTVRRCLAGVWGDSILLAGLIMGGAGRGSRWRVPMPGMKITLSAAMRARDVSRPQPGHEAAAELSDGGGTSARPRPPHAGASRSAPEQTSPPETSRPGPPAPSMAPAAARSAAASQSTTAPVTPSRRSTPAQPPPAAAQPRSPGTPKAPGQNGDAGRGRSGGRGKRHRTRKRGGR